MIWAGLGASHQTASAGIVATLIHLFGWLDGARLLKVGERPRSLQDTTLVTRSLFIAPKYNSGPL